jgi:hypothetical protein
MKIRLAVALAWLAFGFAVPALAQQKTRSIHSRSTTAN